MKNPFKRKRKGKGKKKDAKQQQQQQPKKETAPLPLRTFVPARVDSHESSSPAENQFSQILARAEQVALGDAGSTELKSQDDSVEGEEARSLHSGGMQLQMSDDSASLRLEEEAEKELDGRDGAVHENYSDLRDCQESGRGDENANSLDGADSPSCSLPDHGNNRETVGDDTEPGILTLPSADSECSNRTDEEENCFTESDEPSIADDTIDDSVVILPSRMPQAQDSHRSDSPASAVGTSPSSIDNTRARTIAVPEPPSASVASDMRPRGIGGAVSLSSESFFDNIDFHDDDADDAGDRRPMTNLDNQYDTHRNNRTPSRSMHRPSVPQASSAVVSDAHAMPLPYIYTNTDTNTNTVPETLRPGRQSNSQRDRSKRQRSDGQRKYPSRVGTAASRTVTYARSKGQKAAARLRQGLRRTSSVDRGSGDSATPSSSSSTMRNIFRLSSSSSHGFRYLSRSSLSLFGGSTQNSNAEDPDNNNNNKHHHQSPTWTPISGIDDIEILAQKSGINTAEERFKVTPDYAYPHTKMNRDELRAECRKTSSYFHTFRTVNERTPITSTTSNLRGAANTDYDNTFGGIDPSSHSSTELYLHDPHVIGTLSVEVMQCFGIPKPELLKEPTAFCVCVCGPHAFQTDVMPPVANPMWLSKMRRACIFPIYQAYEKLYVGVFCQQQGGYKDGFAGRIVIDICRLRPGSTYDVTLPIRMFAHIYSRRRRGAIRLRFHLNWYSEQKAVLSYLPVLPLQQKIEAIVQSYQTNRLRGKQLSNKDYHITNEKNSCSWWWSLSSSSSLISALPWLSLSAAPGVSGTDKNKDSTVSSPTQGEPLDQDAINKKYDYGETTIGDAAETRDGSAGSGDDDDDEKSTASAANCYKKSSRYRTKRRAATITGIDSFLEENGRNTDADQPTSTSTSTSSSIALAPPASKPLPKPTISCCDVKAFQNVARVVHGADMPGKFSMQRVKATAREIEFMQIHILRYLRKREMRNLHTWQSPVISGFVFIAWMHCVWEGSLKHLPAHAITLFLLYMWKNYAVYAIDPRVNCGFLSLTWEELFWSLIRGGSTTAPSSTNRSSRARTGDNEVLRLKTHSGRSTRTVADIEQIDDDSRAEGKSQPQPPRRMMHPIEMVRKDPNSMKTAMAHFQQASDSERQQDQEQQTRNGSRRHSIEEIGRAFRKGVPTTDYKTWFQSHRGCFLGSEAVTFLVKEGYCESRSDAVRMGLKLQKELRLFAPISGGIKDFADTKYSYYVFLTNKNDSYEIKTKQPAGRGLLNAVGFANPPDFTEADAHMEFPFATGKDHPRFTVKESLVIRSKQSKQLLLMQAAQDEEEVAEYADACQLGMTKKKSSLRLRNNNVGGLARIAENGARKVLARSDESGADASGLTRLGFGKDLSGAMSKKLDPVTMLQSFSHYGWEHSDEDYDKDEEEFLSQLGAPEEDAFGNRYVVERKVLPKPPPQDVDVVQKSDKKLPDSLNEAKNMLHGMMFDIYNDKVYEMPKLTESTKASLRKRISIAPALLQKNAQTASRPPIIGAVGVASMRLRKNRLKKTKRPSSSVESTELSPAALRRSTINALNAKSCSTKQENQAYAAAIRHEYDKLLGVNKYSNSNLIVQRIAVIIQPMLEMMLAGLCVFRSLFNAVTWHDPYLSFWITLVGPVVVIILHIFPWRLAAFVAGFVLIGPQNWMMRLYRERRGIVDDPEYDVLTEKKKVVRDDTSECQPNYFSSHAPDNRPVPISEIDTSQPRTIVVPNSPLTYNRFYDWPPEPDYSRIYACAPPSSDLAAAQMLESHRFEDVDDGSYASLARKKSKWKKVGKAMNMRKLLKKRNGGTIRLEKIAE